MCKKLALLTLCALALSILSAGQSALIAPLVAIAAWSIMEGIRKEGEGFFRWAGRLLRAHVAVLITGVICFAAILGIAYGALYAEAGPAAIESLTDFDPYDEHGGTSTYYIRAVVYGLLPWSLLLPLVFFSVLGLDLDEEKDRRILFTFIWGMCGWATLTFVYEKYYYFSGPVLAVMAVAAGLVLAGSYGAKDPPWPRFAVFASVALGCLVIRDLVLCSPHIMFELFLGDEDAPELMTLRFGVVLVCVVMAAAILAMLPASTRKAAILIMFVAAGTLSFMLAKMFVHLPLGEMTRMFVSLASK